LITVVIPSFAKTVKVTFRTLDIADERFFGEPPGMLDP
jgi:hypothetical protein